MRTFYDSIDLMSLPPYADGYMGYDDGRWPDADAIAARFPGKTVIRITVFPSDNEGDMLDVESGDATPDQAPGWVTRRRQAGHGGPLVYCSESLWETVRAAFHSQGVPEPGYFVAAYPGEGPVIPAGAIGHQYADAGPYDVSVVVDYLPGIDPAPTPPPPSEDSMITCSLALTPPAQHHGDVYTLKAILNAKANAALSPNGQFDLATNAKLQDWQRFFGLKVDGICGPQTWQTLLHLPIPE